MTADGSEHQSHAPRRVEPEAQRPDDERPLVPKPRDPPALPADIGGPGSEASSASEFEHEDDEYEDL